MTSDREIEGTTQAAIGRRLALMRQVLGLAQGEFALKAGLKPNAYNQYEMGKKRPSIEAALALCDAYDLTLDWIYRGEASGLRYQTVEAMKALRKARNDAS